MSPFIFEGVGPNKGQEREILTKSTQGFSHRITALCNLEASLRKKNPDPRTIARERCFVSIEEGRPLIIQCWTERPISAFDAELMLDLHCTPFTVSEPTNGHEVLVERIVHKKIYP